MLDLNRFYRDEAEQNEWISVKDTHRDTYTPLTWVPRILFTVITYYVDTGCSTSQLTTLMRGYDSNAAIREGIENLHSKETFVTYRKIH